MQKVNIFCTHYFPFRTVSCRSHGIHKPPLPFLLCIWFDTQKPEQHLTSHIFQKVLINLSPKYHRNKYICTTSYINVRKVNLKLYSGLLVNQWCASKLDQVVQQGFKHAIVHKLVHDLQIKHQIMLHGYCYSARLWVSSYQNC